jgi:TRAP-type C4-dicarboxylate transport system permease large subunit
MSIDWLGILFITLPIFIPIAQELGFNQVWLATLICVNLRMAFLTPPFGYSLFYLKGTAPPEMNVFKGRIVAPLEVRARRITEQRKVSVEEAREFAQKHDTKRRALLNTRLP